MITLFLLYMLWTAICRRLRGGMISEWTRYWFNLTIPTGKTRIICSFLITLPLIYFGLHYLLVWPFIFASMTIHYYDKSMGLTVMPRHLYFMSLWGLTVASIMLLPFTYIHSVYTILLAPLGALASLAYASTKPLGGKWTERAEYLCGLLYGGIIGLSFLLRG